MSVISCDRAGCNNIMCDRGNYQYDICWECFAELVELGIDVNIDDFMSTSRKHTNKEEKIDPYQYWDNIFPDKWIESADNQCN